MITLHILYIIPLLCCFGVGVFALLKARYINKTVYNNVLEIIRTEPEYKYNKKLAIWFFILMWFPFFNVIAILIYIVFNVLDYFTNI